MESVSWFINLPLVLQIIIGVVAYILILFGLPLLTHYFFGEKPSQAVFDILGFPIRVVGWVLQVLAWPFTYRRRRLFEATFNCPPDDNAQPYVNLRLKAKAAKALSLFGRQELTRKTKDLLEPSVLTPLATLDLSAKVAKEDFWQAVGIARKCGYKVPATIQEALSLE